MQPTQAVLQQDWESGESRVVNGEVSSAGSEWQGCKLAGYAITISSQFK